MKSIIVAVLLLLSASGAHSEARVKGITGWGVKVGPTFSTIGTSVSEFEGYRCHPAGTIGLFVNYGLSRQASLQMELLLFAKGAGGGILGGRSWRHRYVEIPVLFKYCLASERKLRPSVYLGPAFSVLRSAKFRSSILSSYEETDDFARGMDVGISFGGDIAYKHFSLDVRYTVGMVSVYDPDEWNEMLEAEEPSDIYHMRDSDYIKNRCLSFMLGYRF